MKPVITYPKFKCDFCKKKAVKHAMERHERICYYNPNRVCEKCSNEGSYEVLRGNDDGSSTWMQEVECEACKLHDDIKKHTTLIPRVEPIISSENLPF